jgi:hypothetical protein
MPSIVVVMVVGVVVPVPAVLVPAAMETPVINHRRAVTLDDDGREYSISCDLRRLREQKLLTVDQNNRLWPSFVEPNAEKSEEG